MSEVTQIAIEYREELLRKVARIDAFLRLADDLTRQLERPSVPPRATLPDASTAPRPDEPGRTRGGSPEPRARDAGEGAHPKSTQKKADERSAGLAFRNAFGSREIDLKQRFA